MTLSQNPIHQNTRCPKFCGDSRALAYRAKSPFKLPNPSYQPPPYKFLTPPEIMASRRIVSSEKSVLEKDDTDFKPKDGEKSDIGPAVPAYVFIYMS